MIITLTGENEFAIRQTLHQLQEQFVAKYGAEGIERVDAETLEASRLPDLLQGATLFAPVRLVIFTNLMANKAIQDPLLESLSRVAEATTLVIADAKLDKRTKLYKWLKTKSEFKEINNHGERQLLSWIQREASLLGGEIAEPEARYLLERVGHDQWRLQHEIGKVVSYGPITKSTIETLVEPSPEGTAFDLLDATLSGNSTKVQHLLSELKNDEDPYKLFGLLASQVHAVVVVAAAQNRAADTIAKDSGLHPFVVRKTQTLARRLAIDKLRAMAEAVATCDTQLKSTGADPWQLIALALQKIVAICRPTA